MPSTVTERYAALVAEGEIERDGAQELIAAKLTRLEQRLAQHRLSRKSSALGWLFAKSTPQAGPIRGLYIHGDVGRGKTMLMDLFFAASAVRRKRRAHFHEFMADVHERLNAVRQEMKAGRIADDDPIRHVADALVEEAWLLCFDEFHVTDIADAMILGRLFTRLFEQRRRGGRDLECRAGRAVPGRAQPRAVPAVHRAAARAHGGRAAAGTEGLPAGEAQRPAGVVRAGGRGRRGRARHGVAAIDRHAVRRAASRSPPRGASSACREAAKGVARFSFRQLCEQPLGASDYLRIAHEFHTVILEAIPVMDYPQRNAAKRFIALIDTFYDNAVKLVASAEAEPAALYRATDGYEANEFKRTASRLIEMRSDEYLALPHGHHIRGASGSTAGIVET